MSGCQGARNTEAALTTTTKELVTMAAKQTITVTRKDVEALATRLERRALIIVNAKDHSDLRLAAATLRQVLRQGFAESPFAVELED
jgi:hypothetical protein